MSKRKSKPPVDATNLADLNLPLNDQTAAFIVEKATYEILTAVIVSARDTAKLLPAHVTGTAALETFATTLQIMNETWARTKGIVSTDTPPMKGQVS